MKPFHKLFHGLVGQLFYQVVTRKPQKILLGWLTWILSAGREGRPRIFVLKLGPIMMPAGFIDLPIPLAWGPSLGRACQ